jgi:glycyl-tRNA synthetase (class II)
VITTGVRIVLENRISIIVTCHSHVVVLFSPALAPVAAIVAPLYNEETWKYQESDLVFPLD